MLKKQLDTSNNEGSQYVCKYSKFNCKNCSIGFFFQSFNLFYNLESFTNVSKTTQTTSETFKRTKLSSEHFFFLSNKIRSNIKTLKLFSEANADRMRTILYASFNL